MKEQKHMTIQRIASINWCNSCLRIAAAIGNAEKILSKCERNRYEREWKHIGVKLGQILSGIRGRETEVKGISKERGRNGKAQN